jgi:hypothetical protein
MSVHHMLEPPTEDEASSDSDSEVDDGGEKGAFRSSVRGGLRVTDRSLDLQALSRFAARSNHDPGYMSDLSSVSSTDSDDDGGGYESSDFESDVSEDDDAGDKPGISVSSSHEIKVTQPAFNDAVAENLHADDATTEELDEDHLASYTLGKIYASSGLRRSSNNNNNNDGRRFEIDWALLELEPPRLQPFNLIQGGRRHCKSPVSFTPPFTPPICRQSTLYSADEDWYPTEIMAADALANLKVHCFGRTSGLCTGTISAAMSFVKIKGRKSFSLSWTVVSGGDEGKLGVGGDSGAWVVANESGRVAGHVLAERSGVAYICAMALLMADIRQTLSACRVGLPGGVSSSSSARESAAASASASASSIVASSSKVLFTTSLPAREKTLFASRKGGGAGGADATRLLYEVGSASSRAKSKVAEATISKPRTGWWSLSVGN